MNIALPAFVAFLLLLPGFIFRSRFKLAERTSLDFSPFGRVAADAILWAIFAHLMWLSFAFILFSRYFEPEVMLKLLSSAPANQSEAISKVSKDFTWIAGYFGSLFLAALITPILLRAQIAKWRLDRGTAPLSSIFRFHDAPWYYLLTGADFSEDEKPDLIMISAIVELAKDAVLYVGILDNFFFDSDGNLDRLILQGVARRPLSADKTKAEEVGISDDRFYDIDGDSFVLRYQDVKTLNVQYFKLSEVEQPVQAQGETH
jgi:hypothetical protein